MDVYLEYLVKKKSTVQSILLTTLIIIGTVILTIALFYASLLVRGLSFLFLLAIAGFIYGAWYLLGTLRVEYECIVTNGEMDVDKIMAQRKRKRLVTVKFKDIEIMAPVNGEHKHEFENQSVATKIDASACPTDKDAYFLIINHSKKGMLRLIFTPDKRIINSAKMFAPRKVFTD